MVIPRPLRERAGLASGGEAELELDGAGIRIERIAGTGLVDVEGRLVVPAAGLALDDATVRALRGAERP